MDQGKLFYIFVGSIITIAGLTLSITFLLPTQAAGVQNQPSNEVYVPVISNIDGQGHVMTSSIEQSKSDSKPKITIPLVPTERPSNIAPTVTPVPIFPPREAQPGPPGGRNTPIEGDLLPEVPLADKWSVVLKYPDGRRAKFLMTAEKVEEFLSSQPEGVMLVTSAPPALLMGHIPPTPDRNALPEEELLPCPESKINGTSTPIPSDEAPPCLTEVKLIEMGDNIPTGFGTESDSGPFPPPPPPTSTPDVNGNISD